MGVVLRFTANEVGVVGINRE